MKLLKRNYYIFTLLSICEPEKSTGKWIRYRNVVFTFSHLFLMFVGVTACIIFIRNNFTVDLVNSFGAGFQGTDCVSLNSLFSQNESILIFQVGGGVPTFYTLFAAVILRNEIMKIFDDLQTIYDLSMFHRPILVYRLNIQMFFFFFFN